MLRRQQSLTPAAVDAIIKSIGSPAPAPAKPGAPAALRIPGDRGSLSPRVWTFSQILATPQSFQVLPANPRRGYLLAHVSAQSTDNLYWDTRQGIDPLTSPSFVVGEYIWFDVWVPTNPIYVLIGKAAGTVYNVRLTILEGTSADATSGGG